MLMKSAQILTEALSYALPKEVVNRPDIKKTTYRSLTRRGVVWLGQTCNLRCQFCYFIDKIQSASHPEHAFMSLDKAQSICKTLVEFYDNTSVDLQGGEPTIYREILSLIAYCREIGLAPTLITNALALEKTTVCKEYKAAGIQDFLVSVHGLGNTYDELVGVRGASVRQMRALHNMIDAGIPFRFNCVLSKPVLAQLPMISELAIRTGARVVNFIAFNPFADQSCEGRRNTENVPRYSEIREPLTVALDMLEEADVEANVRYLPLCMVEERHRKSMYNFQQLSYDHHEWDFVSWGWTGLQQQRISDGMPSLPVRPNFSPRLLRIKNTFKKLAELPGMKRFLYSTYGLLTRACALSVSYCEKNELYRALAKLHAQEHCEYLYGNRCQRCSAQEICDGFHGDYSHIFGTEEAVPVLNDEKISDPLFYIAKQKKIVVDDLK